MRKAIITSIVGGLALTGATTVSAQAQDTGYYISGAIGSYFPSDSDNEGELTDGLTISGTGTDLDGATLPAGTPVGWETEFDNAFNVAGAVGYDLGTLRFEAEIAYAAADVDTHSGVYAGETMIDGVDAAVLIEAQDTPLGATVGTIVADGQGEVSTTYFMVNGYYDFETTTAWTPYIGAGIGVGAVDVDYSPSDVGIIDDDATAFAYQVIGGVDYAFNDSSSVFAAGRYRGTSDVEVDVALFPGELEIENRGFLAEIGYRYSF